LAFKLEAHSVIITNCVSFMLMTLSIDRVLAVAFPVLYEIKIFIFFLILRFARCLLNINKIY